MKLSESPVRYPIPDDFLRVPGEQALAPPGRPERHPSAAEQDQMDQDEMIARVRSIMVVFVRYNAMRCSQGALITSHLDRIVHSLHAPRLACYLYP